MKDSSCHDPKMEAYCKEVRWLEDKFHGLELNHIPRRFNEDADELTKMASGRTTVPPDVFVLDLHKPSVDLEEPRHTDEQPPEPASASEDPSEEAEAMLVEGDCPEANPHVDWWVSYLEYLIRGELPSDKTQARHLARRAKAFVLLGDNKELYKHSPSGIL